MRYIPVSIVISYANGMAVLIGLSQLSDLLGLQINKIPGDFSNQIGVLGAVPSRRRRSATRACASHWSAVSS